MSIRHDSHEETVVLARERTRLANRRTFLAWVRTALTFMTFGFLLEKVDVFLGSRHLSTAALKEVGTLGLMAFIVGPLMVLVAGWNYHRLEKSLGSACSLSSILPEVVLFVAILGAALFIVFL